MNLLLILLLHLLLFFSYHNCIRIEIINNNKNNEIHQQHRQDSYEEWGSMLTPPEYNINYQVHSWDDLNEWHQMYRKGVVWNKVDLHYMPPHQCPTSNNNNNGNPFGCFILSHDIPTPLTVSYNTSNDLLNWIKGEGSIYYTSHSSPKHMALCFKLDDMKPCDSDASSFRSLLMELMSNVTTLLEPSDNIAPNLNIILDGDGVPLNCLSQSLQPFNATWVGKPWEARNQINNNDSLGYNRLMVADLPIDSLLPDFWTEVMCNPVTPYYKFLNGSYPVLVWEPSNQITIQSVASSYISCMSSHTSLQFPQLLFASNIDPAQFQSYIGVSSSNHSWNIQLNEQQLLQQLDDGATNIVFKSKILVYTVPSSLSSSSSSVQFYIVLSSNSTTSNYSYTLLISKGIHGQMSQVGTFKLDLLDGTIDTIVSASIIYDIGGTDYLYIYDNLGGYIIYSIDVTSSSSIFLKPLVFGVLQTDTQQLIQSSSLEYLGRDLEVNDSIHMIQYFSSDSCSINSIIWNVSLSPSQYVLQLSPVTCLSKDININSKSYIITSSTTFSSISTLSTTTPPTSSPCLYDSILIFNSQYEFISNLIMAAHVCIQHTNSSSSSSPMPGNIASFNNVGGSGSLYYNITLQSNIVIIDTGISPSTSINYNPSDGRAQFMMVHGGGYCYNTEIHNKRASPRVCESDPIPAIDSKVLNYIYGLFDDLLQHIYSQPTITTSGDHQTNYITSCDKRLIRGVYNHGSNPSTSLFVTSGGHSGDDSDNSDYNQQPTLGVVALHQGVEPDYLDMSICGSPIPYNGLILNSWTIYPNLL